jgi:hypothetical protein
LRLSSCRFPSRRWRLGISDRYNFLIAVPRRLNRCLDGMKQTESHCMIRRIGQPTKHYGTES